MNAYKTALSCITASTPLSAVCSLSVLPFSIGAHLSDPDLSPNEQVGLSAMEVGIAVGAIGVTAACIALFPPASLAVGSAACSIAYAVGTTFVDQAVTSACEDS